MSFLVASSMQFHATGSRRERSKSEGHRRTLERASRSEQQRELAAGDETREHTQRSAHATFFVCRAAAAVLLSLKNAGKKLSCQAIGQLKKRKKFGSLQRGQLQQAQRLRRNKQYLCIAHSPLLRLHAATTPHLLSCCCEQPPRAAFVCAVLRAAHAGTALSLLISSVMAAITALYCAGSAK